MTVCAKGPQDNGRQQNTAWLDLRGIRVNDKDVCQCGEAPQSGSTRLGGRDGFGVMEHFVWRTNEGYGAAPCSWLRLGAHGRPARLTLVLRHIGGGTTKPVYLCTYTVTPIS